MTKFLKISIIAITIASVFNVPITKAQKQVWYKGYQYNVNDDEFYAFKYTRKYSVSGNSYLTIYNIHNPKTGRLVITIIARHLVDEKKIVVDVKNPNGGIFSKISKEETSYSQATLKPFGFRGSAAAFGSRIPNQLMVKFASKKYQNINVMHVNGTEVGSDNLLFYVLDEED